jgi:hypothetical protein
MRRGSIRLRGWYANVVTAVFEPEDGDGDDDGKATRALGPSLFRRGKRPASHCPACNALVVDPTAPAAAPGPAFPDYGPTDTP